MIERELNVENKQDGKGTTMFEKDMATGTKQSCRIVTREFLKKYISFVKSRKAPELAQDAIGYASSMYGALRTKAAGYDQKRVSVPVTVRTLETMIRLATAHSKLRLGTHVEIEDINVACKLLNMTIFNEADPDEQPQADEEMDEENDKEKKEEEEITPLARKAGRSQRNRRRGAPDGDD